MLSDVNGLLDKMNKEYNRIAAEVAARKAQQQIELDRVNNIKTGIKNNVLLFSQKIADCKTAAELTKVQTSINFEKGAQSKSKYQEFHSLMLEEFSALNELINKQKDSIKELEALAKKSEKVTDEYEKLEIEEQMESVRGRVEETKINVQESAINSAIESDVTIAQEVLPEVKARRTTLEYEVKDINLLQKKMPHLVKLVVDEEAMDLWLKTKKTDGSMTGKEEDVINGIRFYYKKVY
jgi:copper chaperone CopZ